MRAEAEISDLMIESQWAHRSLGRSKDDVPKLTAKDLFRSNRSSKVGQTLTGSLGRTLKAAFPDTTVMLKCAAVGSGASEILRDWCFQVETPWRLRNLESGVAVRRRWDALSTLFENGVEGWITESFPPHHPFLILCGTTLHRSALLTQAIAIEATAGVDEALDYIYREFDTLMWAGDFAAIDQALAISAEDVSVDIILALLTATLPIKSQLAEREAFFQRAHQALKSRNLYENGLFDGL